MANRSRATRTMPTVLALAVPRLVFALPFPFPLADPLGHLLQEIRPQTRRELLLTTMVPASTASLSICSGVCWQAEEVVEGLAVFHTPGGVRAVGEKKATHWQPITISPTGRNATTTGRRPIYTRRPR